MVKLTYEKTFNMANRMKTLSNLLVTSSGGIVIYLVLFTFYDGGYTTGALGVRFTSGLINTVR